MVIHMNMYQSLGFAIAWLLVGRFIKAKFEFFQKYCIPAPIVGGFLFALISLALHVTKVLDFEFDTTLQTYWMVMFFTSVGYNAGFSILRDGGKKVFVFLAVAIVFAILQNVVAQGAARLINFSPMLAVMLGSTSFTGGFGTAASFAPIVDPENTLGALSLAVAVPTFGSLISSILGGPVGNRLIKKYGLQPSNADESVRIDESGNIIKTKKVVKKVEAVHPSFIKRLFFNPTKGREEGQEVVTVQEEVIHEASAKGEVDNSTTSSEKHLSSEKLLLSFMFLVLASGFGLFVTNHLNSLSPKFKFPIYIGAMICAAIIRNIADTSKKFKVSMDEIDALGNISLNMFLALALVSLKLWQLVSLAIPLMIILSAQIVLLYLYTRFVTFKVMGGDYDAAVITAGHIGFGFAATPNAMANMGSICEKYGYSKIAFFVVPIVGSLFIDFFNIMIIGITIGLVD
ncbi:sodium/glutamate symporter [Treponema denticola]|uniref:sodium/glutamate symporter n=2 Tax=Treponema denticola TaxID=158 RepID=UPI0002B4FD66|nr:sodium/glutamate symporter [Treponema denticola]EMB45476.1 sodium/glutamate symporter [Treponema denticola AL-2]